MSTAIRRVILVATAGSLAVLIVATKVFRDEMAYGQRRLKSSTAPVTMYDPETVVSPFPAIEHPKTVSREEGDTFVRPEDLVLGLELNGQSRAYPINQLTGPSREIFNDQLGGQAIAATW